MRDVEGALAFARAEAASGTTQWRGMCQMFCRTAWGLGGGFGSAWLQWLGMPDDQRHEGGHPGSAPLGAPLFTKGANPYGHVYLAARELANGRPGAWSNDLVVPGRIHHVDRHAPLTVWGHRYLGWGESLNGNQLPVYRVPPPEKPYAGIGRAIDRLEDSLATAIRNKDWADAKQLRPQIRMLKKLHRELRH